LLLLASEAFLFSTSSLDIITDSPSTLVDRELILFLGPL